MSERTKADERREFIREAAIQLAVAHRRRDPIWQMSPSDSKVVWDTAIALWSGKPEDC